LNKRYPNEIWEKINIPLIFSLDGPGGYKNTFLTPLLVAYFFQVYCAKRYPEFATKYMYIYAVGMDTGIALCILCVGLVNQVSVTYLVRIQSTYRATEP
jgi:OPT oligopeptide transporter protein